MTYSAVGAAVSEAYVAANPESASVAPGSPSRTSTRARR